MGRWMMRGPMMRRPGLMAMRGRNAGNLLRRLNLTQAQQDQIKNVREQYRKDLQAARDKVRAAREKLREVRRADPPDENAVRTAATALGTAQAEIVALQTKLRAQTLKILTPEQQKQLRELRARADRLRANQMRLRQRLMRGRVPRGPGVAGRRGFWRDGRNPLIGLGPGVRPLRPLLRWRRWI